MGIHHIQMAFVNRYIDRLANRTAGVMQPRYLIGQPDEILKILQRAVTAALIQIHHKRRTISR